jgi:hypothetical protein
MIGKGFGPGGNGVVPLFLSERRRRKRTATARAMTRDSIALRTNGEKE